MDWDTSWFYNEVYDSEKGTGVFHPCLELIDEDDKESYTEGTGVFHSYLEPIDEDNKENNNVSIDSVLPNDLLEQILACPPFACISRSSCVCKKWNEIVHSRRFMLSISGVLSQKPWYFMFTSSDEPVGYSYDPALRKWYCFELPYNGSPSWFFASSCGLVCIMNNDSKVELCVFNPFTKNYKRIGEPFCEIDFDYKALAFSVDRPSSSYNIALVTSKQALEDFVYWDISIDVYSSKTLSWASPVKETLAEWRGGGDSVICDGVLYILVHSTRELDPTENRHALLAYNLYNQCSKDKLIDTLIPVPCFLTCGRLMNLKEKLVMVGGIGRRDRPGIIKGISIWVLGGREWEEVSRVPHKYFQGFGELDDVFASSGSGNLIFIQSYGATALLVFDMNLEHWIWSEKCPVTKRFPLQLFTGFSFEPRLDISP